MASRTGSSRTLTATPGNSRSSSCAATGPRIRAHHRSSKSVVRATITTFSIGASWSWALVLGCRRGAAELSGQRIGGPPHTAGPRGDLGVGQGALNVQGHHHRLALMVVVDRRRDDADVVAAAAPGLVAQIHPLADVGDQFAQQRA